MARWFVPGILQPHLCFWWCLKASRQIPRTLFQWIWRTHNRLAWWQRQAVHSVDCCNRFIDICGYKVILSKHSLLASFVVGRMSERRFEQLGCGECGKLHV